MIWRNKKKLINIKYPPLTILELDCRNTECDGPCPHGAHSLLVRETVQAVP